MPAGSYYGDLGEESSEMRHDEKEKERERENAYISACVYVGNIYIYIP